MTSQGDTKRPGSVKMEIDPDFSATPLGGASIIEQTMRSLGVHAMLARHLPQRARQATYASADFAYAALAAMVVGGHGIHLLEPLRQDPLARQIFGLPGAPSDPTTYRLLCELAGLEQRPFEQAYEPAGQSQERLDLWGQDKPRRAHRRIAPKEPQGAAPQARRALRRAERALACRALKALRSRLVRLEQWVVAFGDGTNLEVEGNCFESARLDRNGARSLLWMTLWVGPILVGQELAEGTADEARALPGIFRRARPLLAQAAPGRRVLALLDAAYCEKQVVAALGPRTDWIICANQHRAVLERMAAQQPQMVWRECGPDAGRGWTHSGACLMTHQFGGWSAPLTIAARRWREDGDLPGIWHYAFLATNLEPGALPRRLTKKHGAAQTLWMLYATKQGHENHFKTPLRDMNLHHPPSGRLGVNQVYYTLGAMAANLAMVLRYQVMPGAQRGMTLERMRRYVFQVAARVARSGRKLTVWLAGATLGKLREQHLLAAAINARRLC